MRSSAIILYKKNAESTDQNGLVFNFSCLY